MEQLLEVWPHLPPVPSSAVAKAGFGLWGLNNFGNQLTCEMNQNPQSPPKLLRLGQLYTVFEPDFWHGRSWSTETFLECCKSEGPCPLVTVDGFHVEMVIPGSHRRNHENWGEVFLVTRHI